MTILNLSNQFEICEDDLINLSKKYSKIKNKVLNHRENTCLICGKENIRYCKSHTLPQVLLKNFAENGKVYNPFYLTNKPLLPVVNGIKNTQIFYSICPECDSKLFQDYENFRNYNSAPSNIMLNQIALKNHLYYCYKLERDLKILKHSNSELRKERKLNKQFGFGNIIKCHELDFFQHKDKIQKIYKDTITKNNLFKIGYYKQLSYMAPIAMHCCIGIYYDFVGKKLNDPFSKRGINFMHFCIFPLENTTTIFIFYEKEQHKFDKFFIDLNTLPLEEQLAVINFISFLYCEDIFINKKIDLTQAEKINLGELICSMPISQSQKHKIKNEKKTDFKKRYNIKQYKNYINLLDKKYQIIK